MAIHIRHGNKVNLPTSAPESQPLFVDDTQEMYMGVGTSPPVPIKINASNIIGAGLIFMGGWSSVTDYIANDLVTFNNTLYLALQGNTNSEPDLNPTDWGLVITVPPLSSMVFVFNQSTPASVWVITHNLGFNPACVVEDSSHRQVYGDVLFNNVNQVTLTFQAAFSGTATLS